MGFLSFAAYGFLREFIFENRIQPSCCEPWQSFDPLRVACLAEMMRMTSPSKRSLQNSHRTLERQRREVFEERLS